MVYKQEFVCPCGCMRIVYTWQRQDGNGEPAGKLTDIDLERGSRQVLDNEGDLVFVPREACLTGAAEGERMIELRKKWLL